MLRTLPAESVHACITSPPYWGLRDYGVEGQIGLEPTPGEFVARLVDVFREVRRVLRDDGTLWLNMGDSYAGSGRGGNPTVDSSTLEGGQDSQAASMVKRTMTASRRRDDEPIPRSDGRVVGLKPKDLVGMPWRLAFALQADGWWLRQDIIWSKPNPMPESVRDRCTKAHEYLFLLAKSERYYCDMKAIAEESIYKAGEGGHQSFAKFGGKAEIAYGSMVSGEKWDSTGTRNKRSVWTVATQPFSEAHFATFPPDLIRPCVLAGAPAGGVVLDPFNGAGTTGMVALEEGRAYVGIELNADYLEMTRRRLDPVARQERMFA